MAPALVKEQECGLRVLYDGAARAKDSAIDVIAVHDVFDDPDQAWSQLRDPRQDPRRPENWMNWLNDPSMLPAVLPHARIMRYGYQSIKSGPEHRQTRMSRIADDLLGAVAQSRIKCPKRPIILISHGFGGLAVIRMLVQASQTRDNWISICTRIMGLIFFGTPFRGAHSSFSRGDRDRYPNTRFDNLLVMQEDNDTAEFTLYDYFSTVGGKLGPMTVCIFEQMETDASGLWGDAGATRVMLVKRSSSVLDTSKPYGRQCDHFALNKFRGPHLEDWHFVASMLGKMRAEYAQIDTDLRAERMMPPRWKRPGQHAAVASGSGLGAQGRIISSRQYDESLGFTAEGASRRRP